MEPETAEPLREKSSCLTYRSPCGGSPSSMAPRRISYLLYQCGTT